MYITRNLDFFSLAACIVFQALLGYLALNIQSRNTYLSVVNYHHSALKCCSYEISRTMLASSPKTDAKIGNLTRELEERIRDIGAPLLDFELVAKTIEEWSRPLPLHYVNKPLVLSGIVIIPQILQSLQSYIPLNRA